MVEIRWVIGRDKLKCVKHLIVYPTIQIFITLKKGTFKNIVVKGENASNQHFVLLPHCFLYLQGQCPSYIAHFVCYVQNVFNLDQSNILLSD